MLSLLTIDFANLSCVGCFNIILGLIAGVKYKDFDDIKKNSVSKACRWLAPALTALLAVLNPITLEFNGADPLRRTPLQRDSSVTDVVHAQSDGLTCWC